MRESAAIGSPCVPVVTITTRCGASSFAASTLIRSRSSTSRKPRSRAIPMLRTIDRPTSATRRPCATEASMICCTRATLLAKHAMITRPRAVSMSRFRVGAISLSDGPTPGTSEFVESTRNRSTPRSPNPDSPGRSVGRRSGGSGSSLISPVCKMVPASVCTAMASASGIEWLTAKYSHSKAP